MQLEAERSEWFRVLAKVRGSFLSLKSAQAVGQRKLPRAPFVFAVRLQGWGNPVASNTGPTKAAWIGRPGDAPHPRVALAAPHAPPTVAQANGFVLCPIEAVPWALAE